MTSGVSRTKNTIVLAALKMVWALANCWGVAGFWNSSPAAHVARSASDPMNATHTRAPITLTSTWMRADRQASRVLPIAARIAVTDVPMLAPRITAMPVSRSSSPLAPITITIPVVALELWIRPVKAAPNSSATNGVEESAIRSRNG